MRTPAFNIHTPSTIDEAVETARKLADKGMEFDWISGGTDLIPNYKWGINPKSHVISLAAVEEIRGVSAFRIGAMARLQDIVESAEVHPLISEAAASVASIMIRRSGTLGGNLCLDTRCFWLNQSETWRRSIDYCHKCDEGTGADCRVIPNQNELCVATYQGDLAPALICLGAVVHLASSAGRRNMPLEQFFQEDGITRNVLKNGEIVTHVELPESSSTMFGSYQKLRQREAWDFPEGGVAFAVQVDEGGKISGLNMASTGFESIPRSHKDLVDSIDIGAEWGLEAKRLGAELKRTVRPVLNTWFPPSYRKKMASVLAKRAMEEAANRATSA